MILKGNKKLVITCQQDSSENSVLQEQLNAAHQQIKALQYKLQIAELAPESNARTDPS